MRKNIYIICILKKNYCHANILAIPTEYKIRTILQFLLSRENRRIEIGNENNTKSNNSIFY